MPSHAYTCGHKIITKFLEAISHLNSRNPKCSPRPEHVRAILETMYDDGHPIHNLMTEFFQIGWAMYVMSTQYLMSHPQEYANKMMGTDPIINRFKEARSVPGLLEMLSTTWTSATNSQGTSNQTATRSLLDQLCTAAPCSQTAAPSSQTAGWSTSSQSQSSSITEGTLEATNRL